MIRRRIITAALIAVVFALGWWVGRGQATGGLYENLDLFVEILHRVENSYVEPIEPERLMEGAIHGMLQDLDPYSQYLDAKSYDMLQTTTEGRFSGIGVVVSVRDGYPTVIAPIEGTPAWAAGIHAGDVIVAVEGRSTAGFSVQEAADLLRGPEGTSVRMTVRREGESEPQEYTLTRSQVVTKSVPYAFVLEGRIGYLRLANFPTQSGSEVREAIDTLRRQGAKTLVLDVRRNPGGLLDQAVDVAEQFLPDGSMVVQTKGRAKGQDKRYFANERRPETEWPMVVLVDEGSASASEIVAGALQDLDRALAIGTTSFGKGLVQSVFPLRGDEVALKLTTARYYTPSGRSIHRDDVLPVAELAEEEDLEGSRGAPPEVRPDASDTSASAPPIFKTEAGRTVLGGGGITPDIVIRQDSLPALALRIERGGWAFRFANTWVHRHPNTALADADREVLWSAFAEFLKEEAGPTDDGAIRAERAWLERSLRRELARRLGGEAAAAREMLALDPVFQRAVEILRRAHAPNDVFAAAGAESDVPAREEPRTLPRRLGERPSGRPEKSGTLTEFHAARLSV